MKNAVRPGSSAVGMNRPGSGRPSAQTAFHHSVTSKSSATNNTQSVSAFGVQKTENNKAAAELKKEKDALLA